MTHLSSSQLRRAADIKDKIETLRNEITRLLGSTDGAAAPRKRRTMSAAARAKIAAVARARWAKRRTATSVKTTAKPKRTMSVAGRKRLAQLARARWAKVKAAGRKTL
jgi:hypothetical protein